MEKLRRTLMIVDRNPEYETIEEIDLHISVDEIEKLGVKFKEGDHDPLYYDPYELSPRRVLFRLILRGTLNYLWGALPCRDFRANFNAIIFIKV